MKEYHKEYRIDDEHICKAFKFLKRALNPRDVRTICHFLIHDGNGKWVACDGFRLHEWRSSDCTEVGEWSKTRYAELGEGQYKITKLLKTYAELEKVTGDLSKVRSAHSVFKLSDPGHRGTEKIFAPKFSFPENPHKAVIQTYNLIGEIYKTDSLREQRTFNVGYLSDALQYGCQEVLLGCDNNSGMLYIRTLETTAVIMPIRS